LLMVRKYDMRWHGTNAFTAINISFDSMWFDDVLTDDDMMMICCMSLVVHIDVIISFPSIF
jgi:hypothetical protein